MRFGLQQSAWVEPILLEKKKIIDEALDRYLPPENQYPPTIFSAMRYGVFSGGKRLRPILFLLTAELLGEDWRKLMPSACAMEFIHTSSLLLDDLPCMDNAETRRGRESAHRVYGEGSTVLASFALLMHAIHLLSLNSDIIEAKEATLSRVMREVSRAVGCFGMISGQLVDLEADQSTMDLTTLEYIHSHKTGSLFVISTVLPALWHEADEQAIRDLTAFAQDFGLAFQIQDDVDDFVVEDVPQHAGDATGRSKSTFVSFMGIDNARKLVERLAARAKAAVEKFGDRGKCLSAMVDCALLNSEPKAP